MTAKAIKILADGIRVLYCREAAKDAGDAGVYLRATLMLRAQFQVADLDRIYRDQ